MLKSELDKIRDVIVETAGVNPRKCMRCGKCTATCPNYDNMEFHPNQFVNMCETGDIEKLLASDAAYKCLSCMACVQRCPRQVQPAKFIEAVRLALIRQRDSSYLPVEKISQLVAQDEKIPQQALMAAFRKFKK